MISRRLRHAIASISLAALLLALLAGPSAAQEASLSFAGLVVRHADGELAYAYVGFTEDEINGVELLKRSGLDIVTVTFGGLGEGVCSIDEHGCPATECRKRVCQGPTDESPFWQYFRQETPGDWKPLALGASQTKVRNGDLDGWSWTPKDAGLPSLTIQEIAELAGYNGSAFANTAPGEPGAAFRREGFLPPDDDDQSLAVYVAGAGLLVVALGAVAAAGYRRRRASGVES
jgi:hypothetical protein